MWLSTVTILCIHPKHLHSKCSHFSLLLKQIVCAWTPKSNSSLTIWFFYSIRIIFLWCQNMSKLRDKKNQNKTEYCKYVWFHTEVQQKITFMEWTMLEMTLKTWDAISWILHNIQQQSHFCSVKWSFHSIQHLTPLKIHHLSSQKRHLIKFRSIKNWISCTVY